MVKRRNLYVVPRLMRARRELGNTFYWTSSDRVGGVDDVEDPHFIIETRQQARLQESPASSSKRDQYYDCLQ